MKKLQNEKGFTLVELLAVIVILGIIMVLSVPSVLSTLESARKKTFFEYVDKAFNAGKEQWLLYSSKPYPQNEGLSYYLFDLKEDLGFDNMEDYHGVFTVMECDAPECYWSNDGLLGGDLYMKEGDVRYVVALVNKNYTGAYDSRNKNRIIEDTNLDQYNMMLNSGKSAKEIYAFNQLLSKCNWLAQTAFDTKNDKIIRVNESHASNWVSNKCTEYSDEEWMNLFVSFLMS